MGALEDDLTEHHRMRERDQTIEALRKELAASQKQNSVLREVHHEAEIELAEAKRCRDNAEAALEVYDRTFPKKSELELHAALKAANARIAEFADKGTLQALRDANNRAERAEARVAELEEQLQECWQRNLKLSNATTARAERAEAACEALREALEFYANESNWHTPPHCPSVALLDCGYKARAALNPSPADKE